MALDFDNFPIYDALTSDEKYMSNVWIAFMTSFIQTLQGYLSQYGIFTPLLTTSQRNDVRNPQLGQLIYNTTTNELQVWQVKPPADPAWHVITTTP